MQANIPHPLAAAARREGLSAAHLGVAAGPPPLPLLLLRAEIAPGPRPVTAPAVLRIGLLIDASALPGRRHLLRGVVTLAEGCPAAARLEALEWRGGRQPRWTRVPRPSMGYEGKAAIVAAAVEAWLRSSAASPAMAAALRAGSELLNRSSAQFEADARRHEATPPFTPPEALPRRHALAWAAQQRGLAGQQRRYAALLADLADRLPDASDPVLDATLLAAAAEASRLLAPGRTPTETAPRRSRGATAKPQVRAEETRLRATAPALLAALEGVLDAAGGRTGRDLPSALFEARRVITALRGDG